MRNLKKVLSLALALVMLLGMMVVGAGATEFPDDSSIEYKEAADVLTKIGVITGRDGYFDPKTTLNRAEGAAIIYRMLTGGAVANPVGGATGFVDVDSDPSFTWATGIIADLRNRGIISGVDTTHFAPAGKLKGVEFGKMLLVALGYNPDYQGYTGGGWDGNIMRDCYGRGISVDGVNMSNYITREQAAQMALNTLQATMVTQKGGIQIGDVVIPGDAAKDMENTGRDYRSTGKDTKMQFCEAYFPALKLNDTTDGFGRPAAKWVYDKKDITTVAQVPAKSYTDSVKYNAIYKDLGLTSSKAASLTVDGVADTDITLNSSAATVLGGKGVTVDVYTTTNDDGNITAVDIFVVNTYFGRVTKTATSDDKTTVTISRMTSGAPTANTFKAEGFERGDYVVYTVGKDGIVSMDAAESKTGKITAFASVSEYLRLDGDKYDYNKNVNASDVKVGEATIYLDTAGNVIYVGEVEAAAAQYLYVRGSDLYFDTISIRAVFADGTSKIVELDSATQFNASNEVVASGGTTLADKAPVSASATKLLGNVYAYTETGDNTVKLTPATLATAKGPTDTNSNSSVDAGDKRINITKGKTALYTEETASGSGTLTWGGATEASVYANNNTVYVSTTDGKTYTGFRNVPSMNNVSLVYVVNKNNSKLADLVFIGSKEAGSDLNATYFYVTDKDDFEVFDNYILWNSAYINGEKPDGEGVKTTTDVSITAAGLYKATKSTSDGYFSDATLQTLNLQATIYTGDNLTLEDAVGNETTYKYTEDTLFVYVNGKTVSPSNDTTDIVKKDPSAAKDSQITYVLVVEADTTSTPHTAKTVYVVAAKKADGAVVDGSGSTADQLSKKIEDAEGTEVVLTGITTVPSGTKVPSGKTVVLPSGVTSVDGIEVKGTVKITGTSDLSSSTVKLDGGTIVMAESANAPKLASGAKGTIKVEEDKNANCGDLAAIFAGTGNYAKKTEVIDATGTNGVVTMAIKANPVTLTGKGTITGYDGTPVGGSDGTKTSALYTIKFPETVVKGNAKRDAASVTATYKDGTELPMDGTKQLDGEVVLLLDTNVEKVTYVFAKESDGSKREAITYVFNIG